VSLLRAGLTLFWNVKTVRPTGTLFSQLLTGFELHKLPMRERLNDVPMIAYHSLENLMKVYRRAI